MAGLRILVTGSDGLIGRALRQVLARQGIATSGLDPRSESASERGDVCSQTDLARALDGVTGIVHLGAVSRVIDAERDPALCRRVNEEGTRTVLAAALAVAKRPWVIYGSSREVYGQQDRLPVREDVALRPKNVYARSKVAAEQLMDQARTAGLATAILRFSNVYGDVRDHADRVIPAFARAAAAGGVVRVDGAACTFDFTHVADVADAIGRVVQQLVAGERTMPPIHLCTGRELSLGALADLAIARGVPGVHRIEAPERTFDVHRFAGDPARAEALLGWRAQIALETGFTRLVAAYRTQHGTAAPEATAQKDGPRPSSTG
ncbi:MAG TPA: NAD(P)-dependent oxidoreductase [Dongiaceae bacterium]